MSICDLFDVIVVYIFIFFYHVWEIVFFGMYKATDKLDGKVINTQVLLQVNTVEKIVPLRTLFYTGRGTRVATNLKMKVRKDYKNI
jgi:hypothetical protein